MPSDFEAKVREIVFGGFDPSRTKDLLVDFINAQDAPPAAVEAPAVEAIVEGAELAPEA